jgi:hypothetical protein
MNWKLFPAILVVGLAACTTMGRQASSPSTDATTSSTSSSSTDAGAGGGYGSDSGGYASFSSNQMCDAQPVQKLIGTKLTPDVENQVRQASSSGRTRVLKPGEVMTMEYDPKRINLILDQQGALAALRCG